MGDLNQIGVSVATRVQISGMFQVYLMRVFLVGITVLKGIPSVQQQWMFANYPPNPAIPKETPVIGIQLPGQGVVNVR